MLFWVSTLIFYSSYLFSVLFFVFLIMFMILVWLRSMIYLKYLVVLVYVSGVVIFILYISCMCWFVRDAFFKIFLFLGVFVIYIFDSGLFSKFTDVGEFLWIYLFFSVLFNFLVTTYSLNLFKVSGSLRF